MHIDSKADAAVADKRNAEFLLAHRAVMAELLPRRQCLRSTCGNIASGLAFHFCSHYRSTMAKPKRRYACAACGSVTHRWQGQCADCGEWNTLTEEAPETPFSAKHHLASGGRAIQFEALDTPGKPLLRRHTGIAEFDRALGGGLVPGSAILMGGDPGIGKSTLLLQAAASIAAGGDVVVYISGEEASGQVRMRAERLGLASAPIQFAAATSVRDILTTLGQMAPPALLVIDSIQTMHSDQIEGAPGTVSQVRGCAFELIRYAKESGAALVLVGHVTKDGSIAGPRVLEHMVDVVMAFEGERSHQYRILRSLKNRFGPVDEIGVFAMEGAGLTEVGNPSMLFLSGRGEPMAGSAVFPAIEGTRPVLVEIQALIVRLQSGATPRRAVVGWDSGRMAMLLAVLEARCGLNFSSAEVYLNVAGGYRLADPAADLAVAAALVSALGDKPLPNHSVWFGEVSLAGEIRPVAHGGLRLREAAKLGFRQGYGPADTAPEVAGIRHNGLTILPNLVDRILTDT
jgi:DNA repair protein RadA/Sms